MIILQIDSIFSFALCHLMLCQVCLFKTGGVEFYMSQKRDKGYSQKGKPSADTVKPMIAAEDLETAIHPTKKQNAKQ